MKKFVAFAAICLAVLSFSSCRKDYTCTCKVAGQVVETDPIPKAKKSDAESICNSIQTSYSSLGYNCSID